MNTLICVILGLATVASVVALSVIVRLGWIASGESDTNGDPERDGVGDIDDLPREWDRGSGETERRPNLEYARRTNRNAMLRSAGF